jgi:hypothetical protein
MEVGFYLFFIIIMLLVLLNADVMMIVNKIVCMYTNLAESITIPVSRVLLHREASLSVNYCFLDRNGILSASVCNILLH